MASTSTVPKVRPAEPVQAKAVDPKTFETLSGAIRGIHPESVSWSALVLTLVFLVAALLYVAQDAVGIVRADLAAGHQREGRLTVLETRVDGLDSSISELQRRLSEDREEQRKLENDLRDFMKFYYLKAGEPSRANRIK